MIRQVTDQDIGLKVLRDPPTDTAHTAEAAEIIDIVAIHGIGAHPDDTWCKHVGPAESPQRVNWLQAEDMLPAIAPHARIMRYGYQSQWFGEGAMRQNASILAQRLLLALRRKREEYPHRPLLFIAHCFGGLVVLKALVDARHDESEWPGIFASTTGLIFLGTPFRGAEGMSQVEMLAAAQREYQQDEIQPEVLNILEPGNEFLQEVVDQFGRTRKQANKAHVACFYELKTSDIGRIVGKSNRTRFVVSESSGCLDLSDATSKFSLSRTHFDMNKFAEPTDEDFETMSDVVKGMIEASPGLMLDRSQCRSTIANATTIKHQLNITINCARPTEVLEQVRRKIAEDELLVQQVDKRSAQKDADLLESVQGIKAILWYLLFGLGWFFSTGLQPLELAGASYMNNLRKGAVEAKDDKSLLEQAVIANNNMTAAVQESLEHTQRDAKTSSGCSQAVRDLSKSEANQGQQAEEKKLVNAETRTKAYTNEEDPRNFKNFEDGLRMSMDECRELQEKFKLAQADLKESKKLLECELHMTHERLEKMQQDIAKVESIRIEKPSRTCLQTIWQFFGYS
ncbi:unnamed protein product [Alternaria alternata]